MTTYVPFYAGLSFFQLCVLLSIRQIETEYTRFFIITKKKVGGVQGAIFHFLFTVRKLFLPEQILKNEKMPKNEKIRLLSLKDHFCRK